MSMPTEDELNELFAWGDRVAREAGLTEERLDSIVRKVRALSADPAWCPAPDFLEAFLRHAVERREMVGRPAQL